MINVAVLLVLLVFCRCAKDSERNGLPQATVDSRNNHPGGCCRGSCLGRVHRPQLTLSVGHGENEQSEHGGQGNEGLEDEELAQLVGTEMAEGQMHQPAEEEGQHLLRGDTCAGWDVVGDVGVMVTENRPQNVVHVFGAKVHCKGQNEAFII